MRMRKITMLSAGAASALIKGLPVYAGEAGTEVLEGTRGVEEIARRQAASADQKKALRQTAKRAVNALVEIGQGQIVLGHIQPRWLRASVSELLDQGVEVTFDMVAELRAAGPR